MAEDAASLRPEAARELAGERLDDYLGVARAVLDDRGLVDQVKDVARLLTWTYLGGGRLLLCGNGGSAADAQHVAAEFVGRCTVEREPMSALALADNVATVTAIGNDYGFESVFSRQVRAHARSGDALLVFTTSGRSLNVLRALEEARALGLATVALTGRSAADLDADYVLRVPSDHTGRVQEVHMAWCHMWVEAVERALSGDAG